MKLIPSVEGLAMYSIKKKKSPNATTLMIAKGRIIFHFKE